MKNIELWHQRLGHVNFKLLRKLVISEAVRGLPNLPNSVSVVCGPCMKGKQVKVSHKQVMQHFNTSRCFELLHMDLMGPVEVESIGGKKYTFVCVDNFSRFT